MLRVFSPSDTVFTSNGDAVISAARSIVRKVDNGDFYLDLETGLENIDFIKSENIVVAPTPQGDQPFRIMSTEKTRTKIKAHARHLFYDTENYLISDANIVEKNCNYALDHLNSATDTESPFITLSDVNTIASYRCVRTSLAEAISTLLERWGGHLVRDGFNIQIKDQIGQDNGVTIQYRKNLKEITVSENWENVCTKLLPVGKDGFLLDSLYVYSDIQYERPFTKTVSFTQDIEKEDYEDDEHYYAALRDDLTAQAMKYLEASQYPEISYTLNANLEKITDVGDTVKVFDERLGVDIITHVLGYEYDCILGKYTSVEFGNATASLSNLLNTISNSVDKTVEESNQAIAVTLREDLQRAEEAIFDALGSSNCIYGGDQILIVDALPKETARNVIRINSGGIGFSNSGIGGPFVTAWTIAGVFNCQAANMINLTCDLIKGGTLKLGSALNQSGTLEVYDEQNNLIAQLDKNGLKMYGADGSYILMNTTVGFAGYDRNGNKTFWVSEDEFHQKKSVVEEEITLCNKLRFIPIEVYENGTLVNDGIGLVSVI